MTDFPLISLCMSFSLCCSLLLHYNRSLTAFLTPPPPPPPPFSLSHTHTRARTHARIHTHSHSPHHWNHIFGTVCCVEGKCLITSSWRCCLRCCLATWCKTTSGFLYGLYAFSCVISSIIIKTTCIYIIQITVEGICQRKIKQWFSFKKRMLYLLQLIICGKALWSVFTYAAIEVCRHSSRHASSTKRMYHLVVVMRRL